MIFMSHRKGIMIDIGGGYMADSIPCTVKEIQARVERNVQEQFMTLTVPELFFWDLGLEYVGEKISFEVTP